MTLREEPQPESSDARMRWKLKDGKLTGFIRRKSGLTIPNARQALIVGIPASRAAKLQKLSLDLSAATGFTPGTDAP